MLAADAAVAGSYPVCADSGQGAVLTDREFGMGRGKVFPASSAKSLLNPLRRIVQSPRRTVAAMTLPRSGRVAEIGAGPGFFSPAIADVVPDGVVIVVDLQVEMVQLARGRLRGRSNTQFVVADATRLPFRSSSIAAVVLATMLGEIPDPESCVSEVRRVLGDDGELAVAETRRDSDFVPLDALTALVQPAGFAFDRRRGPGWQYVARYRAT
jgi:ubiquinone/menaquinone biosynthesis C-methylase UbiE